MSRQRKKGSRWRNVLLSVAVSCGLLVMAEVAVRLLCEVPARQVTPRYVPHPHLVYLGNPEMEDLYNSRGWGDVEHTLENEDGRFRIACVGGSTTFGRHCWPLRLEEMLTRGRPGQYEVLNFGMLGYTTLESLINLAINIQDYTPDVLIIHHALNDLMPRLYERVERDYRHFRKPLTYQVSALERHLLSRSAAFRQVNKMLGRTPSLVNTVMTFNDELAGNAYHADHLHPDTSVFRRNISTLVVLSRSLGITPILTTMPYSLDPSKLPKNWGIDHQVKVAGMREHNTIIREMAAETGTALVDLDAQMTGDEDYFFDHIHCTVAGLNRKAELLVTPVLQARAARAGAR